MNTVARKRSPRAPSIALGDAIEKACKIYDMERCHAAPGDAVAHHIGYKNANNGTALSAIASLKYYGLLERPKEGMLAVSKDVEAFKFAPSETIKQQLIVKWLTSPPAFAELLDKYTEALPSDSTLKFELIRKGFAPTAADICLQAFRQSVDYAHYFEQSQPPQVVHETNDNVEIGEDDSKQIADPIGALTQPIAKAALNDDADRIPVRLAGGRRAWIEIPMPFYAADKERLKKQIDLLLTDDEDNDDLL